VGMACPCGGSAIMIIKILSTQETKTNFTGACVGAISGAFPLDILHMMSAGCHLRWGMYDDKFGVQAMNNLAVLQDEKTGRVVVYEARPEGEVMNLFGCDPVWMQAYYQDKK